MKKKPHAKTVTHKKEKLTPKQALFINEYMVDLNATQSAIRAGYSEDTAKQIAHENLAKPYLVKEIEKRMDERVRRIGITADSVLSHIDLIRKTKKTSPKDKLKALELLAKHLDLYKDTPAQPPVSVSVSIGIADVKKFADELNSMMKG